MHKVSIIIPVYNAGMRIEQCLQSVQKQTLLNIEIIIVNDASTDNTLSRIYKYIKSNNISNIRIINLEKNGRAGNARNIGIRVAKGEYIAFLDQDDHVVETMYEEMYSFAKNENLDLVTCEKKGERRDDFVPLYTIGREPSIKEKRMLIMTLGGVFLSLIRRKVLLENNIFFPTRVMFEDALFYDYLIPVIKRYGHIGKGLYIYNPAIGSQTSNLNITKICDRCKSALYYYKLIDSKKCYESYMEEINYHYIYYTYLSNVFWMLRDKRLFNFKLLICCIKEIERVPKWYKNSYYQKNKDEICKNKILKKIYCFPFFALIYRYINFNVEK